MTALKTLSNIDTVGAAAPSYVHVCGRALTFELDSIALE